MVYERAPVAEVIAAGDVQYHPTPSQHNLLDTRLLRGCSWRGDWTQSDVTHTLRTRVRKGVCSRDPTTDGHENWLAFVLASSGTKERG